MKSQWKVIDQWLSILKYSAILKIEKLKLEVQVRQTKHFLGQLSERPVKLRDQYRAAKLQEIHLHIDALCTESERDKEVEKISELLREINKELKNEIGISNI